MRADRRAVALLDQVGVRAGDWPVAATAPLQSARTSARTIGTRASKLNIGSSSRKVEIMAKPKAGYVDGFVIVIPKKNVAAYRAMARQGARVWKKHGALDYKECMLDDANPPMVSLTFPKLAKAKAGETVWFSFITYRSRAHRDRVNAKVMAEMEKQAEKYKDQADAVRHEADVVRRVQGRGRHLALMPASRDDVEPRWSVPR